MVIGALQRTIARKAKQNIAPPEKVALKLIGALHNWTPCERKLCGMAIGTGKIPSALRVSLLNRVEQGIATLLATTRIGSKINQSPVLHGTVPNSTARSKAV